MEVHECFYVKCSVFPSFFSQSGCVKMQFLSVYVIQILTMVFVQTFIWITSVRTKSVIKSVIREIGSKQLI